MSSAWDRLYGRKPVNRLAYNVSRQSHDDDKPPERIGRIDESKNVITITRVEYDALNHLHAYIAAMPVKPETRLAKLLDAIQSARNKDKDESHE